MECSQAQAWISARIDGEVVDQPNLLSQHLETCAVCPEFEGASHRLKRTMAFRPVRTEPLDLAPLVMAQVGVPNLGRGEWRRTLLGAAGLTLLLLAIPGVLFGSTMLGAELGSTDHTGRHLGAFSAALAFGFIYAAWRPERAIGLVPLTSALGALVLLTVVIDMARGNSTGLAEASHLLELVGIALIWTMSRHSWHLAGPSMRSVRSTI